MKPETKKYLFELGFLVALFVAGLLIGIAHDETQTQIACNDHIYDTYVNITYAECTARCDAMTPDVAPEYAFAFTNLTEVRR